VTVVAEFSIDRDLWKRHANRLTNVTEITITHLNYRVRDWGFPRSSPGVVLPANDRGDVFLRRNVRVGDVQNFPFTVAKGGIHNWDVKNSTVTFSYRADLLTRRSFFSCYLAIPALTGFTAQVASGAGLKALYDPGSGRPPYGTDGSVNAISSRDFDMSQSHPPPPPTGPWRCKWSERNPGSFDCSVNAVLTLRVHNILPNVILFLLGVLASLGAQILYQAIVSRRATSGA
jgi:hypothetical protein